MKKDLTYSEAIKQVMLNNEYFAPLKLIYKEIWKYKDKTKIKGKTPDYTIQAIVQREPQFTKIGLGVYALTEYKDILPNKTKLHPKDRLHAKIQGMLLEIGNNRDDVAETYTNDKKWVFENKKLGNLSTIQTVPQFTYKNIISETVRFFDVIWFNERMFPYKIYEVEQSTDFRDAFVKFMELQDFQTFFFCVSDGDKKAKFDRELKKNAFHALRKRCKFRTYEQVENDYKIAMSKSYL